MHQKTPKINFFVIFRNLQKKLPICKKKYVKILNSVRAVVTDVENRQNGTSERFLGSTFCVTDCNFIFSKEFEFSKLLHFEHSEGQISIPQ